MVREVISIINIWCDNTGRHDTDQVPARRSVSLAYDGKLVRLDLCDECRDEMAAVLDEYAGYGEVVEVPRSGRLDTAWTAVEENNATAAPPSPAPKAPSRRSPAGGSGRGRRSAPEPEAASAAAPAEPAAVAATAEAAV